MSPASIGALRKRLVLEEPVRTSDGGGGASIAWQAVATLWARVQPLAGDERHEADRTTGRLRFAVTVRHRAGVRPEMRFRLGARALHILSVRDEDERGRWLHCLCEERGL